MFLLFGTRAHPALMNSVSFVCGYCGTLAEQQVVRNSLRLTLFFIPLFPLSTTYSNTCTHCGGTTKLTAAQARHSHSLEWARTHPAI
ncbi:zinc-ribbon domain-containing protein [Cryobacterium sp. TMT1-21]|uniref:Zinc-ribbon domain-containing protein n=1 Tax=Cryobacterium shii TaxID=1259235 RepID=A0AAQ2HFG9_9MICO|nr:MULTISPECIES: zinc-ribbon domain-containing protein [Cryobacterium]TFC46174.1 zinc-ribbon domain-containing protein [Cryobacterium shii]TFC81634.1 zinc-ribbon domain-containing protein [Cryobacterium sp. TmT2-59]TFD12511.1 zinc-ribbon domain-containing protein [Cryobacterium sp. TMT4-10]TFD13298.1 zinc-ribbon domain-containing protein [Cryobacterium sp. TMT1-21]TFD16707.1 zinc-ribbon domain-containing protein [Cryobacterium sp. TMT2-23]